MHRLYDHRLEERSDYFTFAEDEHMLHVACRACDCDLVYATYANPGQIRVDMDLHLQIIHPLLWQAIAT